MAEPQVYKTFDKAKRDELFHELRTRGRGAERLAVRFSGVEQAGTETATVVRKHWVAEGTETRIANRLVRLDDGKWHLVPFERTKPRKAYVQTTTVDVIQRLLYRSTWLVAHPSDSLGGN